MSTKKPCALLMNDIHISKDNIPEFQKNWDEALAICKDRGIKDVCIGGDLWQSRSSQNLETLIAVRNAVLKAKAASIVLTIAEGNHDKVDSEAMEGYGHIFQGYQNVNVIDDYEVIDFTDNLSLTIMSYFPENGSFSQRLKSIINNSLDKSFINILYIHQGINGGLSRPGEDELPANIFEDFDSILVGHYHDRKHIQGTKINYIGSSRQHSFGEDEEKGYTILYSDGSTEFIKNQVNTRYKNIEVNYEDINSQFFQLLTKIKEDSRYKIKVKVSCYSDEASSVDKQKLIEAGATKVEVITEQIEIKEVKSQSFEHKFDKSGIKEEYLHFCSNKEIDNAMGLEYLDKIN